jgi:hypothetical protein
VRKPDDVGVLPECYSVVGDHDFGARLANRAQAEFLRFHLFYSPPRSLIVRGPTIFRRCKDVKFPRKSLRRQLEIDRALSYLAATMNEELCAYCDDPATTRDHVPSKKLFTPPLPDNLITVPACDRCNNGASDDDEVFRNELSIMAGSFGESAKAAERLQPTMRGIQRNKATLARMVTGAQLVERYTQSGLYLRAGVR